MKLILQITIVLMLVNSLQAQEFKGQVLDTNNKITDVVNIKFVSKQEYLIQKKKALPFVEYTQKDEKSQQNGIYSLPCEKCPNHLVLLPQKDKYGKMINYKYMGQILGQHLVGKNWYEQSWEYDFIDTTTGKQTHSFWGEPKVVMNKPVRIFDVGSSATEFSGTYFYSASLIRNNPLQFKENFKIILFEWMLNYKKPNSNYFVTKDGTIYAEVISEKVLSQFSGNKKFENCIKYICIKPKNSKEN